MQTPYGHFSADGHTFCITTPDIPRNWYNYLYNDYYITFTSQCGVGQGFLQDDLGRRLMPVAARGLYAITEDAAWSLFALPVYEPYEAYECEHRIGSTAITLRKHGIESICTLFVPNQSDPLTGVEASLVRLTNTTAKSVSLKLISYTENNFDGAYRYQAYNTMSVNRDDALNGLHLEFTEDFYGKKQRFCFFTACGSALSGYDCARNAFIGTYGTLNDPAALHRGGCSNSACTAEKMGFAVQTTLNLAPGETQSVVFLAGVTDSVESASRIAEQYKTEEQYRSALSLVTEKYGKRLSGTIFDTPDPNLTHLLNDWLHYQTDLGSRWARVRHNGYRDIASDTECLATFNPSLAWERIKRLLAYQYANGYAPRTFIDGAIRDNNFSDCAVWLTFTVCSILKELGKPELLNETVPFNDGSSATVYEHLRRAVEFLYHFKGHYGLVQIWGGDWNDCMNDVGTDHKGVSVWLSIAWVRAARQFRELAEIAGHSDDAALVLKQEKEMCAAIEKYGWDEKGGYYIYAISDDLRKIGSSDCEEGCVFLNPQLWAYLAGGLGCGREEEALEHAYALLQDPLGTRVSAPPYTEKNAWIGSIAAKAPGVQENGGVYLHAMCWKLAVDGLRGDRKRVAEDIVSIAPASNPVVNGRAEPYIVCNCYMGRETGYRYGTPGQSWRTASGQWFLKSMTNFVFGLIPTFEGLAVRPCLPEGWKEAAITKTFRGCKYRIQYKETGEAAVYADGVKLLSDLLPLRSCSVLVTY